MADGPISGFTDGAPLQAGDLFVIERSGGVNRKIAASQVNDLLAYGTRTSNRATGGTSYAGGVDILASALSFTADGTSDYLVELKAQSVDSDISTSSVFFHLNLDGSDAGVMSIVSFANNGYELPVAVSGILIAPSAGSHTVNVRMRGNYSGATFTLSAGAGGAGTTLPAVVLLRKLLALA